MRFRNEYYFLSNMYPCTIHYNGFTFSCVEAAFQAQKDLARTSEFVNLDGFQSKKLGKQVTLRPDWDNVKLSIMEDLIHIKFQNERLASFLKQVQEPIIEENTWHDTYWGKCNGIGENHLGIILENEKNKLCK